MNYKQEVIKELTEELLKDGFRVFIAESGHYGFYTDQEGTRIISFQVDYLSPSFSGNYRSQSCGTGWGIDPIADYDTMLNQSPPHWATQDEQVRVTTLQDHLDRYQSSSKYQEVKEEFEAA